MYFVKKLEIALENQIVLLKDPVGPNDGPRLAMDPLVVRSCVSGAPCFFNLRIQKIWRDV